MGMILSAVWFSAKDFEYAIGPYIGSLVVSGAVPTGAPV